MFLIARNILAAYRAMALEFRQLAVFVVVVVVVVVFVLGVCACGNERRRALQCGADAWLLGWVKKCRRNAANKLMRADPRKGFHSLQLSAPWPPAQLVRVKDHLHHWSCCHAGKLIPTIFFKSAS